MLLSSSIVTLLVTLSANRVGTLVTVLDVEDSMPMLVRIMIKSLPYLKVTGVLCLIGILNVSQWFVNTLTAQVSLWYPIIVRCFSTERVTVNHLNIA
jgi:hypothetical protein